MINASVDNSVLTVVIDRMESRNALSLSMIKTMNEIFSDYRFDESLKLAVIKGTGDHIFASGGDLKELMVLRELDETEATFQTIRQSLQTIRDFPLPVVAAINGKALGGGAELALSCDMRVAAFRAEIGFVQRQLALSTAWGGCHDLIHQVGSSKAIELMSTGRILSATQSLEIGLINHAGSEGQSIDDVINEFTKPMLKTLPHVLRTYKAYSHLAKNKDRQPIDDLELKLATELWVMEEHWNALDEVFFKKAKP